MTQNAFYDYLKWDLVAAAGNARVGLYDDSSGPNNLLSESASLAAVANYTTKYAITEVQVLQTSAWLTHNQDNAGSQWSYWGNGTNTRWYRSGFSYGAFPNPWGGVTNDTNNSPRMKTGHN